MKKIWMIVDETEKVLHYIEADTESAARFLALREFPNLVGRKFWVKPA